MLVEAKEVHNYMLHISQQQKIILLVVLDDY